MGMGMGIGLHIYIVAKGSRGVLKKKKAKNRMLKLWHSKCREAKPAFTKNTGASRFKQKCCQQGVKLSSVQCSFISGCTWSCVCQVQGALCASIRTSPRCSLFCPSVHVDHKVKQTPSWLPCCCLPPDSSNRVLSFLEVEGVHGFLKAVSALGQN